MLTFGSLFAGIGGIDLGFERAGMTCKWQVEIDSYCQKVLAKHWPDVFHWPDVKTFPPDSSADLTVDIIAGGFPCQDVSYAGKREGLDGERSGLFFEMMRVVDELKPSYVVIENVSGIFTDFGLSRVLSRLHQSGFDAEWQTLRASDFGMPHRRERAFIIAYSHSLNGLEGVGSEQDRTTEVFPRSLRQCDGVRVQAADPALRGDHGLSQKFYRDRGRAVGNAVAVDVAHFIGTCIGQHYARSTT